MCDNKKKESERLHDNKSVRIFTIFCDFFCDKAINSFTVDFYDIVPG